jgi:hypothetical protein
MQPKYKDYFKFSRCGLMVYKTRFSRISRNYSRKNYFEYLLEGRSLQLRHSINWLEGTVSNTERYRLSRLWNPWRVL